LKVQFLDLAAQYKGLRKDIIAEVSKVCDSQHYVLGKHVAGLEAEIAAFCTAKYAVGVASGTDALLLSLMALGIGPGDRVITTPYTFFSTASSISRLGAVPVFVDIDPKTYNIDPDCLEKRLKRGAKNIKAVMPVHLYGQTCDMGAIKKISRKYGLKIVEDAAQAIGATYKGRQAGSIGDLGALSFYPSKNLGGFGDGGMVTTNSKALATKVGMLRVHGCHDRYFHKEIGINSRLDELQAVVLRIKLKKLKAWTKARVVNAARYDELFSKAGLGDKVVTPFKAKESGHVYNQYVIRVSKRDKLREYLTKKDIGTGIYYPLPLHLQECFKGLGYKRGSLPVSEGAAKETLALPIYPELSEAKQKFVVSSVAKFYAG
jgi:dTDP-4-amino-4,6-dideoxygalactose transaminase